MGLLPLEALLAPAATLAAVGARPGADPGRGPAAPDDETVLHAARAGDTGAFARLVRAHQAAVFGVALRICGLRADAEELAQDAFLQLHAHLQGIEGAHHVRHWLLRTVSHRAIDRLRQRDRRPRLAGDEALDFLAAEPQGVHEPLLRSSLAALLAQLPAAARAVLVLRYQEDLDPADIAGVLGMPLNTVKSHLRRSLDWLRARVAEPGP